MKSLFAFSTVFLTVLGLSPPAGAADQSSVNVAGGYSFSYITNDQGMGFPLGWFVSADGHVTPWFAIAGEATVANKTESLSFSNAGLSFNVTNDMRLYTFMVGPKFTSSSRHANAFAQFLVGGATLSNSGSATGPGLAASGSGSRTYFAFAPGAGADIRASKHFGLRVFGNFQMINTEGVWGRVLQTGVGLVWSPKAGAGGPPAAALVGAAGAAR